MTKKHGPDYAADVKVSKLKLDPRKGALVGLQWDIRFLNSDPDHERSKDYY